MRTSVSLSDELASYVGEVSSSIGENNAEAIRETIRHAREQDTRVDELQAMLDKRDARIDDLERDVERLQNEKKMILAKLDEHQELVKYVEDERTDARRWRQAGLGTKLKWQLFGMPDDNDGKPD